ncbi:MAG: OmpA family protein [Flavobacteriaceae bacterium]|nr:OmpA family protein [Flavobacteriaceae bacterium]
MKRIFIFLFTFFLAFHTINSQNISETIIKREDLKLDNSNSWAISAGVSNFIMHGDLRSVGTGNLGNFWNFGGYAYVDKMFNPLLGLELKFNYSKISGGAQYFSDVYEILYLKSTKITNNLFFRGTAYGGELNIIFSFTNLYIANASKWHFTGYFGAGYHQYDSALFERLPNGTDNLLIDFGNNPARNSVYEASSIYLSAQIGLKYRINKRIDIELRPAWYFNYEDHLDAAISNKQDWETYLVTNLGLVIKLGKKKIFTIWGDDGKDKRKPFQIIDSDKDGVIDELDIEPNTPKGVMVYGNGKAIDSDKDGLPDYKDKCPLKFGPESNNGCPIEIDSDKDGVIDSKDLCPDTPGEKDNKGCPKQDKKEQITQQINLLATSIYFDTNRSSIKSVSYSSIDKIIELMKQIPNAKFLIEGHTDNKNTAQYNLILSQKRANAVKDYFIKSGINPNRLATIGYGESRPKYSNENDGGRQLNRRVEIKPIK